MMLDIIPADDEDLLRKLVYGLVGNRAGMEFVAFHKLNAQFEDVLALMRNPDVPVVIPNKVDRKYALCAALFRITMQLSSDFAAMAMSDAAQGMGQLTASEAATRLFEHPAYQNWMRVHGNSMRKHRKN